MSRSDRDLERVGELIRSTMADVQAPPALRAHVEAQRAARRRRPAIQPVAARRRRPLLATAGASLAGVAAALALVLAGGAAGGPTVAQAVAAALSPANAPAPATDPRDPRLLRAAVGSVRFPTWAYGANWRVTGSRHERLDGRPATVVYYHAPGGRRIGYAIVSGPALGSPSGGRTVTIGGVRYAMLRRHGAAVVVWERGGHTCVLAGHTLPAGALLALAAAPTG